MTAPATLEARVTLHRAEFVLDVDLTMRPGEVVLLTGDNGAGKSTLVRAIAGAIPIDAGCIAIGGRVVDDPGSRTFVPPERRGVGLVHQDARPFPRMTAVENVAFGLRARGVSRASARSTAMEVLIGHGLAGLADRRGAQVSGGEGRRIVMARTLAVRPDLLLLDEPLSAIDGSAREALIGVLRSVAADHDTSILLVTHDPDELSSIADRRLHLVEGRLSPRGPGPVA
jgi:molybdate transport system ATP-binding protein